MESILDKIKEKNKKPNNPNAFPYVIPNDEKKGWDAEVLEGMTLRDYFASKAMQGLLSDGAYNNYNIDNISATSYAVADSMLNQRLKENETYK